jgi:hypothetical protein
MSLNEKININLIEQRLDTYTKRNIIKSYLILQIKLQEQMKLFINNICLKLSNENVNVDINQLIITDKFNFTNYTHEDVVLTNKFSFDLNYINKIRLTELYDKFIKTRKIQFVSQQITEQRYKAIKHDLIINDDYFDLLLLKYDSCFGTNLRKKWNKKFNYYYECILYNTNIKELFIIKTIIKYIINIFKKFKLSI